MPPPILVSAIGLLLSSLGSLGVAHFWDVPAAQAELNALGDNRWLLLQTALGDVEQNFEITQDFFQSFDGEVGRAQFDRFASWLPRIFLGRVEIDWAPRVRPNEVAAREFAAAQEGLAGYHVRLPEGASGSVDDRQDLFLLLYIAAPLQEAPRVWCRFSL